MTDVAPTPLVALSALEHWRYCPRQCALIHIEAAWRDNDSTTHGALAHQRVDRDRGRVERGVRVVRGLPLWSERLGLVGKADVIELRPEGPRPIEYKVGRRRSRPAEIQLCAQALCLEEMFETTVPSGAIYHARSGRRRPVEFDGELRAETLTVVHAVRVLLQETSLPSAPNDARCRDCSLEGLCLPGLVGAPARVRGLRGILFRPLSAGETADA
jgi:CRISPR-associated exonuclease Cas4